MFGTLVCRIPDVLVFEVATGVHFAKNRVCFPLIGRVGVGDPAKTLLFPGALRFLSIAIRPPKEGGEHDRCREIDEGARPAGACERGAGYSHLVSREIKIWIAPVASCTEIFHGVLSKKKGSMLHQYDEVVSIDDDDEEPLLEDNEDTLSVVTLDTYEDDVGDIDEMSIEDACFFETTRDRLHEREAFLSSHYAAELVVLRRRNRVLSTLCGIATHPDVIRAALRIQRAWQTHLRILATQRRLRRIRAAWVRLQALARGRAARNSLVGRCVRRVRENRRMVSDLEALVLRLASMSYQPVHTSQLYAPD